MAQADKKLEQLARDEATEISQAIHVLKFLKDSIQQLNDGDVASFLSELDRFAEYARKTEMKPENMRAVAKFYVTGIQAYQHRAEEQLQLGNVKEAAEYKAKAQVLAEYAGMKIE